MPQLAPVDAAVQDRTGTEPKLVVLSLGAGVQSSVMALMAAEGEIEPMPDAAIFADTQWEPRGVYDHLDWLETQLPFPVYRVTQGDIRTDRGAQQMPLFLATDGVGMSRRQCTKDYKVRPLRRETRRILGYGPRSYIPPDITVEQWIGISWDEIQRMKDTGLRYIHNRWPLIEMKLTRSDCKEWFHARHPKRVLPRSACIGCPYHSNAEWQRMKDDDPESWADAVDFDRSLRDGLDLPYRHPAFLHRSLQPLSEVGLTKAKTNGTESGFDAECEGMCGN